MVDDAGCRACFFNGEFSGSAFIGVIGAIGFIGSIAFVGFVCGIGIIYAVAISVFGGTAQFVVAWLTDVSGSELAPAWYMCAALAMGVCAMVAIRETAPIKQLR